MHVEKHHKITNAFFTILIYFPRLILRSLPLKVTVYAIALL